MDRPVIAIVPEGSTRQRKREAPRGRRVDPVARAEVQALLGDAPRRADLLIEHLHKLQDRFGHLSAAHLAALAAEMALAQAEVFEVATFYHHFDVVKEGDVVPPALTVRVCDGLSCEMAGAQDLLARLPALLGDGGDDAFALRRGHGMLADDRRGRLLATADARRGDDAHAVAEQGR